MFLPRLQLWWWRASWVPAVLAVAAGVALQTLAGSIDEILYAEGADPFVSPTAASTLLAAVGGGMVTFTGVVFSFIVLVLQFGSSQYSPRTVSLLARNRLIHWVLALFVLTITFCFTSLIEVSSLGREDFEPQTSVVIAVALLMACLIGFAALLYAVTGRIRVDRVLADIGSLARRSLHDWTRWSTRSVSLVASAGAGVPIRYLGPPGQLVAVQLPSLLRLADRHRVRLDISAFVGDAVAFGSVIATVRTGSDAEGASTPVWARKVGSALVIDLERSLRYDPLYALRLLTDVAIKALSPAINDPTTAVRSIDEIEGVLRVAAFQRLGALEFRRGAGSVVLAGPSWQDVCDLALLEIIDSGGRQPQISRRLIALLDGLEADLPEERRPVLRSYRRLVLDHVGRYVDADQQAIALTPDRQGLGAGRSAGAEQQGSSVSRDA